jgi:hypothetical protein
LKAIQSRPECDLYHLSKSGIVSHHVTMLPWYYFTITISYHVTIITMWYVVCCHYTITQLPRYHVITLVLVTTLPCYYCTVSYHEAMLLLYHL